MMAWLTDFWFALLAFLLFILLLWLTPLSLTEELGWIGFYTGIFILLSILFEGTVGVLTQFAALMGIIGAFSYLIYELWLYAPWLN